jgi:hypothetical protein
MNNISTRAGFAFTRTGLAAAILATAEPRSNWKTMLTDIKVLTMALIALCAPCTAHAQSYVWQAFNYYASYGPHSTYNGAPPLGDGPWGPSGWPGRVWFGWDVEVAQNATQYIYIACDTAGSGEAILGRFDVRINQAATLDLSLAARSNNEFTRVTASLRSPTGQTLYSLTADPLTTASPMSIRVSLLPGMYQLRVESPSIVGGPRSGPGEARLTFVSTDGDGDGIHDAQDGCPQDPSKTSPGTCGCGIPDVDSDGDGVPDCIDGCPSDPAKTSPGTCGCGQPDTDTDGDRVPDCTDGCPSDHAKTSPGACGCGQLDTDSDSDGSADCDDNCAALSNPTQVDCDSNGVGDVCEVAGGAPDFNQDTVPDSCQCLADLALADHQVNGADLGALLAQWGPATANTISDLNRDGRVSGADLGYLLNAWGPCTN